MSDNLEQKIELAKQSLREATDKVAYWTHEVELRQVRLKALEEAATLRPVRGKKCGDSGSTRRGRKPGAISRQWQNILMAMTLKYGGGGALENEILEIANTKDGLENTRPKDVHERMESYKQHGYVTFNQLTNKWSLTEVGAQRFNADAASDEPEPDFEKENAGAGNEPTPAS